MDKVIIYGLFDPRTGECFYIGKTSVSLKDRLYQHIYCKSNNLHKINKIKQILSCGLQPRIAELLTFDDYYDEVLQRYFHEFVEMYFIQYAKDTLHCPLVNLSKGGEGGFNGQLRKVFQFDLNGKYINQYNSIKKAEQKNKIYHISQCCSGKVKKAGNYQWSFENNINVKKYNSPNSKPIIQYNLNGEFVNKYDSIIEAQQQIKNKHISDCCLDKRNTAGGYIWKFLN